MFCPICGKDLNDNARFCTACGTQMKNTASPAEAEEEIQGEQTLLNGEESLAQPEAEEKEKLTFAIGPIIFSGVLVLVLAVSCGILGGLYASERDKNAQQGDKFSRTASVVLEEMPW